MAGEEKGAKGESAYGRLRALIVRHRFRPSQKLFVRDLADELRLSATPVREALIRLAAERLVVTAPNHGFYVRALNVEETLELHDLLGLLLAHALRYRRGPVAGAILGDPDERAFIAADADGAALALAAFHRTAAMLAANREIVRAVENCSDRLHYVRAIALEDPHRRERTVQAMRAIVASLRVRNMEEAALSLERHFAAERPALDGLVREGLLRAYLGPGPRPREDDPDGPPQSRKA